jgi:hypothetical protein
MSSIPGKNWEMAFGNKLIEECFEVTEMPELPFDITAEQLVKVREELEKIQEERNAADRV